MLCSFGCSDGLVLGLVVGLVVMFLLVLALAPVVFVLVFPVALVVTCVRAPSVVKASSYPTEHIGAEFTDVTPTSKISSTSNLTHGTQRRVAGNRAVQF